jgi:hypothetical protein
MKAFGTTLQNGNLSGSSYVGLAWGNRGAEKEPVMKKLICSCAFALGLAMGLSACTDPYDPGQRAIGGGLFGEAPELPSGASPEAAAVRRPAR